MSSVWFLVLIIAFASGAAILAFLLPTVRQVRSLKIKASALRTEIEPLSKNLLADSRKLAERIKSYK